MWLPALAGRPRWVLAGGIALLAATALFVGRVHYDHNLLHLQSPALESVRWEHALLEHTAGASWHALSHTATPEEALALKARYEQLPSVSRVVEVASLVPADQEEKLGLLDDVRHRLRNLPRRGASIPRLPPDLDGLADDVRRLLTAVLKREEGGAGPVVAGLRRPLTELRVALASAPPGEAAERLRRFEGRMADDLAEDLHRLREVATPQPITLDDLPADLRERHVSRNGRWLLRVFGRDSLWDYGPLGDFVAEVRAVDAAATGKPFTTLEGLNAMQQGFARAGVYALAAIVLVLLADFRGVGRTLLALTPLAAGVVLTLGVMGLFGLPLNPANMIALPLIVGVGVDNGVHVLHDYLGRPRRPYALGRSTGRGILVTALTTVLGFGTLTVSGHRGLAGLGLVLALGVGGCTLSALVFLPAALRLIGGGVKKATAAPDQAPPRLAA